MVDHPSDPNADPGWRPALRGAVWFFLPGAAIRQRRRVEGGRIEPLMGLRSVFVTFGVALALIGLVVLILWSTSSLGTDGSSTTTVAVAVGAFGLATLAAGRLVERRLDCSDDRSLTSSYTTRFFLRLAFGESPALAGFVGFILCGNPLVYFLGVAFAAGGFWRAAPTARNLAEDQDRLRDSGCGRSLMVALRTAPPSTDR